MLPGGRGAVPVVNPHDRVVEDAVRAKRTVMLVGGLDVGKTTLARRLLAAALAGGRTGAYLDTDLGQKTVGPPTAVTLKLVRSDADLDRLVHDAVARVVSSGGRVLLQAMDCSKLGWRTPSATALQDIARRWPDQVQIVIDACQSGAAAGTIHRYDAAQERVPANIGCVSSHGFGLAAASAPPMVLTSSSRARWTSASR